MKLKSVFVLALIAASFLLMSCKKEQNVMKGKHDTVKNTN